MPFTVTVYDDVGVRELADRVVRRIVNRERLASRRPRGRAAARRTPAGWPSRRARSLTSLWRVGRCRPASVRSRSTVDRVAVDRRRGLRPARTAPRGRAAAAAPASTASSSIATRRPRAARSSSRSPGSNGGTVSNDAVKVSGWPSSTVTSRTSGVSTGSTPALAQRVVDRARDEVVRDVVKDLILEALLDDARRRLAGTEAGNARLARVVARDAIDLGVDDVAAGFRRAGSCAFR